MDNYSYPPEEQYKGNENGLTPDEIQDELNRLSNEQSESFPLDVYPNTVRQIITDAERYFKFPADFTAASILAATAAATGNAFTAKRYPAPFNPLASVFLCLIGEPGIGKTHPLSFALKPLKDRDDEYYRLYEEALKRRKAWERLGTKARGQTEEPPIPVLKKFLVNDATSEAFIKDHKDNPRGLTIYVDELSGWVSSFGRYNKGSDVEMYLSMWSGQPTIKIRVGTGTTRVPQPCISVIGTSQPDRVAEFMQGFEGNGMLQRFLFCIPRGLKKAKWSKHQPQTDIQRNWANILSIIADAHYALDGTGCPLPKILDWTDEAKELILSWQNETADRMNESSTEVKERFAKLETYLPRFALILHLLRQAAEKQPLTLPITEDTVQGAIQLVNYFDREAVKVLYLIRGKQGRDAMNQAQRSFVSALPAEFTTSEARQIAETLEIPMRTAENWLQKESWFEKIQHGKYKKLF